MVVVTRPLRGSRLSSFYPPVPEGGPSLSDLDSAFQLQEYISLLIRHNPHDVDSIVTPPGRVKRGDQDDKPDADAKNEGVDEACWIYEQLRRLAQDLTHPLVTSLQQECTRASCPEMKAGEWLYLCVAHGNDGAMEQCCAIDYIIHTLDSATALLNSPRAFPSRISVPQPSIRHFSSLARRLGRIFAHAYFHHREVFESSEAENSLYARFLALTARFDLVPAEFLVIPPRMMNSDTSSSATSADIEPPRLLGASLHTQPTADIGGYKEKRTAPMAGLSGTESPRKVGRNRTDTMVFSDVEAFTEALRGQAGSPSAGQEMDASNPGPPGGLSPETPENDSHTDSSDGLTNSGETSSLDESKTENQEDSEGKPYTLTFSASGTMKTALPPGISPSSNPSGLGLAPSPLQSFGNSNHQVNENTQVLNVLSHDGSDDTEQFGLPHGRSYADSVNLEERAPASEGEAEDSGEGEGEGEESALDTVLSQELSQEHLERDETGDARLVDLLARRQVLEGRMSEVDLHGDGERSKRGSEGEFVVASRSAERVDSNKEAQETVHRDGQTSMTLAVDPGLKIGMTTASVSEVPAEDKKNEASLSEPSSEEQITGIDVEKGAEDSGGGDKDPDTSLETDLADVESALCE